MGMRFEFYSDPIQQSLWRTVITRIITHHDPIRFGIQTSVYDGKLIKYGKGMITGCFFNPLDDTPKSTIVNWTDYISTWTTKWAKNGLLAFRCRAYKDQQTNYYYAGIKNIAYGNISLYADDIYYYNDNPDDAHVRMALIEIDNEDFIAFYVLIGSDPSGAIINALVVSLNVFDGSYQPRYTPPTTPDIDGGYGTGETPNGQQQGGATGGNGGDHIGVYPPNVEVNVEVNMPEPEKVARAQPSSIHIALIGENSLNCLVNALWGADQAGFKSLWQMFENYKFNPIAGVIACMRLPRWVTSQLSTGNTPIGIAGTTILGFVGGAVGQNTIIKHTWSTGLSSGENPTYLTQFKDFKDFVGVTVRAYAPFIGWFDLDPSLCFGGNIEFRYFCDVASGNLGLEIWGTTVDKTDTQKHEMLLATGSGNCAYPVVIAGNDNGMGDFISGFTQSAIGIATSVVGGFTENPMAVLGGTSAAFVGMGKIAVPQSHTTMVGDISGSKGYLGYLIPFVQVIKPRYVLPDSYEAVYGRPVSGGKIVSDFKGMYAELDVHCSSFGYANASEQRKIIELLAKGVHV